MKTDKIQSRMYVSNKTNEHAIDCKRSFVAPAIASDNVSFQGIGGNTAKHGWRILRQISDAMKEITEVKNAIIAAIGTGIIAPVTILISPGKGDKEDKDKKFLQALRQPLSALFALGFQLPATMIINRVLDSVAYGKQMQLFKDKQISNIYESGQLGKNIFDDDTIGSLIPDKKYLAKKVTREEISELESKFEETTNGISLRQELENKIKENYKEVGLTIPDEKLEKCVMKDKEDFLRDKIADRKHKILKEQKINDIIANRSKYPNIEEFLKNDLNLVDEGYQNLAENIFKAEYKQLEENANLSIFDKMIKAMGFETKKTKALDNRQKEFKKAKGLELLKQDKPEIFNNTESRIRNFVEAYQKNVDKYFGNKKYWISLLVNLFMVTASCFALNWAHPRVNKMIENRRAEKEANAQKAEVK